MAAPTLEQGIDERERLRPSRARNYRVKAAAGFACDVCGGPHAYVVKVGDGDGDEAFAARCSAHKDGARSTPGQRTPSR